MLEKTVQAFGLVIAFIYVVFGIDDLVWDLISYITLRLRPKKGRLPFKEYSKLPPKLLAIMIAAWHEDNVIEGVVSNLLKSMQYPRSLYHVFIGVYPNDEPTKEAVRRLEKIYENVHMIVNERPGPTCKADNVNNIIRNIKRFEEEHGWRFASITVHDSEDVVHPQELKLTNYLIDNYDALQFPVIPLQRMPSVINFFSGLTTGTYADEFAENHFRTIVLRENMSALVPSAGTGFAISHNIIDYYGDEPVFPEDSLTEDYKLSLTLTKLGFKIHYVLEKVPRLREEKKIHWDYVATRSFFPDTFSAAVRQKTRWIYGITMQSINSDDIFKKNGLSFAGKYSLYKDLKSKFGNLITLPGYIILIYFFASLVFSLPMVYPKGSPGWTLSVILTFMMIFRQYLRAVAIKNFYGFKSMIIACLLPPLLPIRLVWANIINMTATLKAWKMRLFGAGRKKSNKKVAWNKTDHTFLPKLVLHTYYRNIGDVLLEREYISPERLNFAVQYSRNKKILLGKVLLDNRMVNEKQLMEAVAAVKHMIYVDDLSPYCASVTNEFKRETLAELLVFPILKAGKGYVFAISDESDPERIPELLGIALYRCDFVFSTKDALMAAIGMHCEDVSTEFKEINSLLKSGRIDWTQAVHALKYKGCRPDVLEYMGLKPKFSFNEAEIS